MSLFRKISVLFIISCFICLIAGCFPGGSGSEEFRDYSVASIDGKVQIMFSDLYNRLAKSDLITEGGFVDTTIYFDTLKSIVTDSLVSLKAQQSDLKNDLQLFRDYRLKYYTYYANRMLNLMILDKINPDSTEIENFYRDHREDYFLPEQVLAKLLTISGIGLKLGSDSAKYDGYSDEELDSIAQDQVIQLQVRIKGGEDFSIMAYENSVNRSTAMQGGSLGYFVRNAFNKEIDSVAFSMAPGTLSDPFESPDGWHLMFVEDHVDSGAPPLTGQQHFAVLQRMKNEEARRQGGRFMDSLYKAAEFVFNDSALNEPVYEVDETIWSVIVNGRDTIDFYRVADVFNRHMQYTGLKELSLEDKHKALMAWAQKNLIIQAGDDLGYGKDTLIMAERERVYNVNTKKMIYRNSRDINFKPSDSIIRDYYEKHKPQYSVEKPIKVQHIIVQDSLFGEYLRDLAMSGIDFLELAREHYPGEPEIREAAADLDYIAPGEMPDEFFTAAMGLQIGSVSHPVKTEFGYHIIKLFDKQYTKVLEEVRIDIVRALEKHHNKDIYSDWIEDLSDGHLIEYHIESVTKIELPPKAER